MRHLICVNVFRSNLTPLTFSGFKTVEEARAVARHWFLKGCYFSEVVVNGCTKRVYGSRANRRRIYGYIPKALR